MVKPTALGLARSDSPTAASPSREQRLGDGISWLARWSGRWVLIMLGAVGLGLVVKFTWSILLPILLALIVTTVLVQPVRFLERRLRMPPALAALSVLLGSLAAVVGTIAVLAPAIGGQASTLFTDTAEGVERLRARIQASDLVTGAQIDGVLGAAQNGLTSSGDAVASGVLAGAGAVSSIVITVLIVLALTFFFLKDGDRFLPLVRRMAGPTAGGHVAEVLRRSWEALAGYVRTQALVSLIDAVLVGIALLIVGVPLAIPLAVLTFAGGFVPIVGAFVVGAVAVLVALVSNGLTSALIILAVIVVVQQLEGNVLSPWLQSRSVQLHPAVVLLSVALGSTLFGIAGAFLAVPAAAVLAVVARYLDEELDRVASP